jgi:hypothetical protein
MRFILVLALSLRAGFYLRHQFTLFAYKYQEKSDLFWRFISGGWEQFVRSGSLLAWFWRSGKRPLYGQKRLLGVAGRETASRFGL